MRKPRKKPDFGGKAGETVCGRYYVDEETAKEINEIVGLADERVRKMAAGKPAHAKKTGHAEKAVRAKLQLRAGDIHPTQEAPVLIAADGELRWSLLRWGFPGFREKQVIFNARSESALEKRMFRESAQNRRIVVPATWFYEWNRRKEKNIFYRKDQEALFMAGIYSRYQDEERFVILTTQANASMQPVHDRMPLLLERDEVIPWIFDGNRTGAFLCKVPYLLERRADFEQMSLF